MTLPGLLSVPRPFINPQRPLLGVSGTGGTPSPEKLKPALCAKFGVDGVLYRGLNAGTRNEEDVVAAPGRCRPAFSRSPSEKLSIPARACKIWKRVGSARSNDRNFVRWDVTICLYLLDLLMRNGPRECLLCNVVLWVDFRQTAVFLLNLFHCFTLHDVLLPPLG